MSENLNIETTTAAAVVSMVKNQISREKVVYKAYVEANKVTSANVAEHVKALRELAYPGVKADGRAPLDTPERKAKKFADKVRLGLRYYTDEAQPEMDDATKDYLAAVIKSVDVATDHGIDAARVMAAVTEHINALLS